MSDYYRDYKLTVESEFYLKLRLEDILQMAVPEKDLKEGKIADLSIRIGFDYQKEAKKW